MTVLPIPGTSSNKTCPLERSATSRRSITSSLPTMSCATLARTASVTACTSLKGRGTALSVIQTQLLSFNTKEKSFCNAHMSVTEAISLYGRFLGELHRRQLYPFLTFVSIACDRCLVQPMRSYSDELTFCEYLITRSFVTL